MKQVRAIGLVLHPLRDSAESVALITRWAADHGVTVMGLADEVSRLRCAAEPVSAANLSQRSDLLVALGGDGTVLRAMRLADSHKALVLGVNLGKLGFLAEVDIPDLSDALNAVAAGDYQIEHRTALDAQIGSRSYTAFNDIVLVRVPGQGIAAVHLSVEGHHFVSYAADALIVATPTGSTAYNFSAGGPIVAPSIGGILVTPSAPHSVFNRSLMVDHRHSMSLIVLPGSGRLAVEVDGHVERYLTAGDDVQLTARTEGAHVVRFAGTTFYQRAQRKLGVASSAELGESPSPLAQHIDE